MAEPLTPLYLGIDGGGSKTLAVIVDAAGRERGRGVAGSSNHEVVGLEQALTAIHHAAERAALAAGIALPVASAWLGLSGVDHPGDCERMAPRVSSLARAVRISNDAELALSALPQQVGVALIAGTGSIALGRDAAGRTARVGGWGHVFGDEGSGYAIGRAGLQAAARAADGRGPSTALLERILTAWELDAPEMLLTRVYQPFDKTAIAALAPLVLALAAEGDDEAQRIEANAARELALAATTVAHALDFPPGPLPLACAGGVLAHHERLRGLVIEGIAGGRETLSPGPSPTRGGEPEPERNPKPHPVGSRLVPPPSVGEGDRGRGQAGGKPSPPAPPRRGEGSQNAGQRRYWSVGVWSPLPGGEGDRGRGQAGGGETLSPGPSPTRGGEPEAERNPKPHPVGSRLVPPPSVGEGDRGRGSPWTPEPVLVDEPATSAARALCEMSEMSGTNARDNGDAR